MLIENKKEIYNLAWLDSDYFDKEGFLLVRDYSTDEQYSYVERFCRIKGNLLFILQIPSLDIELKEIKNFSRQQSDSSQTTQTNQVDLKSANEGRIKLLNNYYRRNSLNGDTNRGLIYTLVLNEFGLRKCDENSRQSNGFIIEFYNVIDFNTWHFQCLTIDDRDCWFEIINRANYVNLKSIFNLLLERKLNLIKKRNRKQICVLNSSEDKFQDSNESNVQTDQLTDSQSSHHLSSASDSNLNFKKSNSLSSLSVVSVDSKGKTKDFSLDKASTANQLQQGNQANLIHQISKDGLKTYFLTNSYFQQRNGFDRLTASYSFTLSNNLNDFKLNIFEPNIFVKVYCSLDNGLNWSVLGRTETLKIRNPPIHHIIFSEKNKDKEFKSYLDCSENHFDDQNYQNPSEIKFAKKFYLNLYEKIELQNNLQKIVEFDLDNNQILLKFNVYNLVETFTNVYILIGSGIDYFKPNSEVEILSSIHYKSKKIGKLKMTTLNNDLNIYHNNDKFNSNINRNHEDSECINENNRKNKFEFDSLVEPQLFVNTIHRSFQFELNTNSSTKGYQSNAININLNELMAEPVLIFTLVQDLMNIFMDDEKKLMNCITYSLGEVRQEYQKRQMQVLESHLRLVNLITESINSLNQVQSGTKFFRQSVQKNEIFFQFVPLNLHLQKTIFNKQLSRSSALQKRFSQTNLEIFDVLDIYTHGCFCAHRLGFDNGGLSKFLKEIELSTKESNYYHLNKVWKCMLSYFKIVNLSKQVTELNDRLVDLTLKLGKKTDLKLAKNNEFCDDFQKLKIDLQSEATQQLLRDKIYCQKVIFKLFGRIEKCCQKITNILDPKEIEITLSYLDAFRAQHLYDEQEEDEVFGSEPTSLNDNNNIKAEDKVSKESLNNKPTNNSLKSSVISTMRSSMKFNLMNSIKSSNSNDKAVHSSFKSHIGPSKAGTSISRTISCPIDHIQSSNKAMKKAEDKLRKMQRHNSDNHIEEDHLEFEPVELIHLNIKASLISMQSKLNQLTSLDLNSYKDQKFNYNFSSIYEKIVNEMKPSTKKLKSSIESLIKTSSLCYAIESLKLTKEQSEYFYLIRSRRNMIFSQVLTAFTIGLIGELTSFKVKKSEDLDDYLNNLNILNNNDLGDLNDLNNFNDSNYLNKLFEQGRIICFFESLLSCYTEEIGMLQDTEAAIKELNSVEVLFVNLYHDAQQFKKFNLKNQNDKLLNNGIFNMPKFEGNGYNVQLTIPFYDANLPEEFSCKITGLLFNIGINETATLAETLGHVKIQEEINKKSFLDLEKFVTSHADIKNTNLVDNLTALRNELYSSRAKNVRIFQLTEQIAYDLEAIRFTNCKSGKDRTAMACTLEQIRKAGKLFNFNELTHGKQFQQMLDTLRSEGTRRENTRKNVGVAKYAFNSIRVLTFPSLYRPPNGTYSNIQT